MINSKKYIIFFLFIQVILVLYIYSNPFYQSASIDKNTVELIPIKDAVDSKQLSKETITVYYGLGIKRNYPLYFSIEQNTLSFTDFFGQKYRLSAEESGEILSDQKYLEYYSSAKKPSIEFLINDESLNLKPVKYEWDIFYLNGQREKVGSYTSEESLTLLDLSKNSVLSVESDIEPEKILINGMEYESEIQIKNIQEATLYEAEIFYDSSDFTGKFEYSFLTSVEMPIDIKLSKDKYYPGDLIAMEVINVNPDESIEITSDLSKDIVVQNMDNMYKVYIPINIWTQPGQYTINITSNLTGEQQTNIEISEKSFETQYLKIDQSKVENNRDAEAREEYRQFSEIFNRPITEELFASGRFLFPVPGRITTEFGEYRYINDFLTSYRHSGIDIANTLGYPIKATNYGEVIYSDYLKLTGNTVVIDHGYGIYSVYLHLHDLYKSVGDFVEKGEWIGEIGSTGFSTGPHLHFTIKYKDTFLDPYYFMSTELDQVIR